ncbi:hypothetical protein D3Z45_15075 [Lachnospiraceae bacterium]|nr:hypothetical protein [Lachnospiraceae bacterium]
MIITETQKKEIEQLIPEHGAALIAYGADMYRRGIITGAVWLAIGVGCSFLVEGARIIYKQRKSKKESEEES